MFEKLNQVLEEIETFKVENQDQLEKFRLSFIGRKGKLKDLFAEIKNVAPEQRKQFGEHLNKVKDAAEGRFKTLTGAFEDNKTEESSTGIDFSLPVSPGGLGALHPISQTRKRIIEIFEKIGFNVSDGPEIEDDWHIFSALNFPPNHPAREMQDTFFIDKANEIALRTHTSSVQVRVMENQKPPLRTLSPGRVYRNETISARAHCIFHQVEGLYVNENVSFADLKQTLYYFAREMFGKNTKIRFRPSYFPFTEPSAEVDISCNICQGDGCNVCKHTGWVEIAGSGMVDPNVFTNCGIDAEKYTGFAFGMGIERIAMLKYRIKDLRLFTENDTRFLKQFTGIS